MASDDAGCTIVYITIKAKIDSVSVWLSSVRFNKFLIMYFNEKRIILRILMINVCWNQQYNIL